MVPPNAMCPLMAKRWVIDCHSSVIAGSGPGQLAEPRRVAYRLCSLLTETCERMLTAEDKLMEAHLDRLLFLRPSCRRLREAREAMEDILEARLLALGPEFDDLVNSALSEVVGQAPAPRPARAYLGAI